tara:strand:- start:90 stop:749 length:660 start_codon:yes stop_codon:yes gene_type:complete
MYYSIIIPVHNEAVTLNKLLYELKQFSKEKHEIIIIDDGSTDDSYNILNKCTYIRLISFKKNMGKGSAIRIGLEEASNDKIVIFDGDMEIDLYEIKKLMVLNKEINIDCAFGSRFDQMPPFTSFWNFGNLIFTIIFNIKHNADLPDALCCAKTFYKKDIDIKSLKSIGFDIDIELATILIKKKGSNTLVKKINYKRRSIKQGKKLKLIDGWTILKRILK